MRTSPALAAETQKPAAVGLFARLARWLLIIHQKGSYERTLRGLSARQLRDIGVDPRHIVPTRDMEIDRLGQLDLGWRQPPRPIRR